MQWHDVTRKIFGGPLGGQAKFWGGSGPPGTPLAPPLVRLRPVEFMAVWFTLFPHERNWTRVNPWCSQ